MATVKRTTSTTVSRAPQRTLPPLPEESVTEPDWQPETTPESYPDEESVSDVVPVGAEQLARSQEVEAMGVEAWKQAHDERGADYQQQQIEGVGAQQEETYSDSQSRR